MTTRPWIRTLSVRAVSSAILIALVIIGVTSPIAPFVAIVALFIVGGLWEFFGLAARKGLRVFRWPGLLLGAALPWITWQAFLARDGSWLAEGVLLWLLVGVVALCVIQFIRRASQDALTTVATTVFGVVYVAVFFSFLVRLKLLPGGTALVGFVLVVTKLGDMGSYIVGVSRGRTPLIPRISPKKTVEGFIGGLVASIVVACLCRAWLPVPAWGHALGLGLLLGVGTLAGDLIESLFKRDAQVKDSGSLAPGLGGVLDVIDSLLFTIPVFYAYVRVVWF